MSKIRNGPSKVLVTIGGLMILASSWWLIKIVSMAIQVQGWTLGSLTVAILLYWAIIWLPVLVIGLILVASGGLFRRRATSAGSSCPSCQRLLKTLDAPCGHCGASHHLASSCVSCQGSLSAFDRFCRHCGATR